jgi:hypothetical protein
VLLREVVYAFDDKRITLRTDHLFCSQVPAQKEAGCIRNS